jgi:hypothetical protein
MSVKLKAGQYERVLTRHTGAKKSISAFSLTRAEAFAALSMSDRPQAHTVL